MQLHTGSSKIGQKAKGYKKKSWTQYGILAKVLLDDLKKLWKPVKGNEFLGKIYGFSKNKWSQSIPNFVLKFLLSFKIQVFKLKFQIQVKIIKFQVKIIKFQNSSFQNSSLQNSSFKFKSKFKFSSFY